MRRPGPFFLQSEEDATAVAPQELTRLEFAKGRTCASAESARPSVRPSVLPTDRPRPPGEGILAGGPGARQAGCTSHYCKFLLQLQSFPFSERARRHSDELEG